MENMLINLITAEEKEYLVDEIEELLRKYDYETTTSAVERIIDTWAENKASLIRMFKTHPNYIPGQFAIAMTSEVEREIDAEEIHRFTNYINDIVATEIDYTYHNHKFLLFTLPDIRTEFLSEYDVEMINGTFPTIKARVGQKTSRAINKIMTLLKFNEHPDYNRRYAAYADALSPRVFNRPTILSINPLDYYTMSFGNSWASCHTIDKSNARNMPNSYQGMYSSGTESYMLDGTSMVLYTVSESYHGTKYWSQDKINRQMFHYDHEKLIQGRLYPQSNDGNTSAYTPFRQMVQDIISIITGCDNMWIVSKDSDKICDYTCSYGTHYRDYRCFSSCTLSRLKDSTDEDRVVIGHDPICPYCGESHDRQSNILCYDCKCDATCACCGTELTEDEIYYVGDYTYCGDCVTYCDCCGEYVLNGDAILIEVEDRYVCDSCLDEYYAMCDRCGDWYRNEDVMWVESESRYVCNECLDEYYSRCGDCGEWYANDDLTSVNDGDKHVCGDCIHDNYSWCDDCGEWCENDSLISVNNGSRHVCSDCFDKYHNCNTEESQTNSQNNEENEED